MNRLLPARTLTEEQRLREIAEILAAGALRSLHSARHSNAENPRTKTPRRPWELVEDETEQKILRYLQHHVAAEPVRMRRDLNLAPMTLVRRLARLRLAGLVRVNGRTRGARYELAGSRQSAVTAPSFTRAEIPAIRLSA